MPDIRFTLFDSDNFYQQGLRLLLQDYLHSLNECQRRYPQFRWRCRRWITSKSCSARRKSAGAAPAAIRAPTASRASGS